MSQVIDTGCHAASLAAKSARVDVVSAYPITPQTSVVEEISSMIAAGEMDCRFLPVEGEHSAMAACAAASAAGARVFTATSSQGLLYMHEILHMVSGSRLPVVMANVNRAVHAPWSIWVDHNDSLAQRDTGWLQYYCASVQEIYNTILQAFYVAEKVSIPVMVNFDGFVLSHCMMPLEVPDNDIIDSFLPSYKPKWHLDTKEPTSLANVTMPPVYEKFRSMLSTDTLAAKAVVKEAAGAYQKATGMWDGDVLVPYLLDDAEVVILSMGSMAAELEVSVDYLRRKGLKVGALRLRLYRPFPKDELCDILPPGCTLVVLDRNYSFGHQGGVLACEAKAALFDTRRDVKVKNTVMGIGGVDLTWKDMANTVDGLVEG